MVESKGSMKGKSEFYGIFKGRVETSLDPLNIGRAKVRIPSFHGIGDGEQEGEYIIDEDLPWASYCSPFGAGCDHGTFIPHEKGDYVWVMFENGDPEKPVIVGGSYGTGATAVKNYGEGDYQWTGSKEFVETPLESTHSTDPTTKVIYKSPKGASFIIEEKNNEEYLSIIDRLGQSIVFSSPYGNEARRRELCYGKDEGLVPSKESSIVVTDASDQCIKLINNKGKQSRMELYNKEGKCLITMDHEGLITINSKNCNIVVQETLDVKAKDIISLSETIYAQATNSAEIESPNITLTGDTIITGTLTTKGNTTLNSNLSVGGSTNLNSNLSVRGSANISGSLKHGGPKCC